MVNILAVHLT